MLLSWNKQVRHFHATDCLAFWAASFPIGYETTGEDVEQEEQKEEEY
jgi:hypothetical protein